MYEGKGFQRKSRVEIVEDMQQKAKNLFGNDINLSTASPLGIMIQLFSWPLSLLWSALEKLYNSYYINTATGQDLDNLCKNIGIARVNESKAVGVARFEGDPLTSIAAGTKIETLEDKPIVFETTERAVIENDYTEVEIIALEGGTKGNLAANTLTELVNPISGIDSVTNPDPTDGGIDTETDTELRERYKDSLDRPGGSTINSIRANILQNSDASACLVLQNVSMDTDEQGVPAKSYEAIVLGGTDEDVASAIFEKSPAGIESYGVIDTTVVDDSGNEQPVLFSRAEQIDIYVKVSLGTDGDYPDDGPEQVKDEIIEYIGGINSAGDSIRGLSINENVIQSRIISLMYNIDGVVDVLNVEIGLDANNLSVDNINIDAREVARTELDFIEVT